MKTILIICCFIAVFCLANASDAAAKKAIEECNNLYPYKGDSRADLFFKVVAGEDVKLDDNAKCNLFCVLQNLNFVNSDGLIKIGEVLKTILAEPILQSNPHILPVKLYQINRTTKNEDGDKCHKALISYHRLAEHVFVLSLSELVNEDIGLKDEINKAVSSGNELPPKVKAKLDSIKQKLDSITSQALKNALPKA